MRVALRTVTDDGDLLALDDGEVAVFVVINFHEISSVSGRLGHVSKRQMLSTLSPRAIPVTPLRTVSRIDVVPMAWMKLSSLSLVPASWMV